MSLAKSGLVVITFHTLRAVQRLLCLLGASETWINDSLFLSRQNSTVYKNWTLHNFYKWIKEICHTVSMVRRSDIREDCGLKFFSKVNTQFSSYTLVLGSILHLPFLTPSLHNCFIFKIILLFFSIGNETLLTLHYIVVQYQSKDLAKYYHLIL